MSEIPSPCNLTCVLENKICIGCKRTIDEIVCWGEMKDEEKLKILQRLKKHQA